jgi:hypothetical protein
LVPPGEQQLDVLPRHVIGTPPVFEYHPFRSIDFIEQAYIRKKAAQRTAERIPHCGAELFMDFGFLRASTDDYTRPNKDTDQIVFSYDGHCAYLLIEDSASRRVWAFLTKSKEPPITILNAFMSKFGTGSGIIRTDQGGKLAQSNAFRETMLKDFGYVVECTGADSPSQNGGAEIYNNTLAVKVRTLLYGSGLPAKFWSAALLHAVYLHNRLVHSATHKTPYEGWHSRKPDVTHLKMFGSRVCVKRTGSRRCKLDRHNFTGLFLGYTATNQNIIYLDTSSGIVKSCHHAVFDEAWYLQPTRPPAAHLRFDLGLEAETSFVGQSDSRYNAINKRFWIQYHSQDNIMANSTLANTHLICPSDSSETYASRHKLLPFQKYINLTHSDTFIHGPFDFTTINNRKSQDRICQSDWNILKSHCDLYHNPLPRFDVPTYSVHVDAGAHTTFYSAALLGDLFSSAQRTLHTPH